MGLVSSPVRIDKLLFLMINYLTVKIIGGKVIAMSTTSHRLERTKFVFIGRTEVRVGGFDMYI